MLRALLEPRITKPLFWAAALFAFVMAVMPHPPHFQHEPGDKIQHITAFATLAFLGFYAFPGLKWWKFLLGLSLFGAAIEFIQAVPVLHRDSDVLDWLADTLAAASVLGLMNWLLPRDRKP